MERLLPNSPIEGVCEHHKVCYGSYVFTNTVGMDGVLSICSRAMLLKTGHSGYARRQRQQAPATDAIFSKRYHHIQNPLVDTAAYMTYWSV